MAKVFYYSKKFSEQGASISAVGMKDLFTLSRKVEVSTKFKLGYSTYSAELNLLKNYTLNDFKTSNIIQNFSFGNGLVGNGTVAAPLGVDTAWVDDTYVPVSYWNYTQVGDPSDFTLPISGSYFSVSYPYTNDTYSPTAIVEGNGDMRILRHVTNGEDMRVVYSTWKNYRATSIKTLTLTDIVYHPPGLNEGEFIRNVYPSSGTAMAAEIHNANGFKEFAFIILNDTSIADFHKVIRMGNQPITVLMGKSYSNAYLQHLRGTTMMAAVIRGKNYIGMVLPPNSEGNGIQTQFAFAEVSVTGVVTRIKNWTATNTEGLTRTDANFALINQKVSTTDLNDKDGVYYCAAGVSVSSTNTLTGTSPFQRASWVDSGDGTTLTLHLYTYCAVNAPIDNTSAKTQSYYIVNLEGRTVIPEPTTGKNRRPIFKIDSNGKLYNERSAVKIYDPWHHRWAISRNYQLLPNGDRICWITGNVETTHQFALYIGTASTGRQAGIDTYFAKERYQTTYLDPVTPTPIISGRQMTLVHDNMIQIAAEFQSEYTTVGNVNKIVGSPTAKNYTLLQANSFAARLTYPGYALNNNRSVLPGNLHLGINHFRKGGQVYYHNAMWSPALAQTTKFAARIDTALGTNGTYSCDPSVYTALENYVAKRPLTSGYKERHASDWLVVPPYPGIGYDYAVVKITYSDRIKDASDARGYRYTTTLGVHCLVPAKYRVDSLNNVTLESLDLTAVQNAWYSLSPNYNITRMASCRLGACAVDIDADKTYVILRGGGGSSDHYDGNRDGYRCRAFTCNPNGSGLVNHSTNTAYAQQPVVHPTLGFGLVDSVAGLGTYYVFIPVIKSTMRQDSTAANQRILSSARPAAGFNLVVTSPITVYANGVVYEIPVQTRNLADVSSAYKSTKFFCYAVLFNGKADLLISKTLREETAAQIYIGTIMTSATEITTISCKPVTRWEVARASVYPAGNTIPVSTGLPSDTDVMVWENAKTIDGEGHEFLWGSDDIIDTQR